MSEKVDRRSYIRYGGTFIGGAIVGAAAYGVYDYTQKPAAPTTMPTIEGWNYIDAAKPYAGTKLNAALLSGEYLEKAAQEKKDEWLKTGVDIEFGLFGYTTLNDKTQSTLRAGASTYDIIHIVPSDTIRYYNHLEQLEPYLENPNITDPQLNLWDFTAQDFSGYWDFTTNKPEMPGKIIGINYHAGGQGMIYRKDLLEKAGLNPPKTWDEYLEAVIAVTNENEDIYGSAFVGKVDPSLVLMEYYLRVVSIGGKLFEGNTVDKNVRFLLDSEESIEAANRLYELIPYSPPGVTSYGFTECMDQFRAGKVGFITIWTGVAANLFSKELNPVADSTELAPVPGKGEFRGVANKGGGHLSIPKYANNKEAAWLFIQWYVSKEMCKYRLLKGYTGPVRYSLMHDQEVLEEMPYVKVLEEILAKAKYMSTYALPNAPEVHDVININLNSAFTDQKTIEDACNDMNDECNDLMKRDGLGG